MAVDGFDPFAGLVAEGIIAGEPCFGHGFEFAGEVAEGVLAFTFGDELVDAAGASAGVDHAEGHAGCAGEDLSGGRALGTGLSGGGHAFRFAVHAEFLHGVGEFLALAGVGGFAAETEEGFAAGGEERRVLVDGGTAGLGGGDGP